eukprot:s9242_g1.t1
MDDVKDLAWHVSSVADVAKRLRPGLSCFFFTVDEYVGIHIASGLQYYRTHGRHWALSIDKGTSVSDAERTHAHPRSSAQCSPAYCYVHTCLKTIVSRCEALSWMKALGFLENAVATARVLEDRLLEADLLCLVAKARAACNEPGAAAAKEALAIYEALGLPALQLGALEALIEACKAKQNTLDATTCGESLASIFRTAGKRKEEGKVFELLSRMKPG